MSLTCRAKTNKAQLPGTCEIPKVATLAFDFVIMRLNLPAPGGAPLRMFTLEVMDLDENETRTVKHVRNAADDGTTVLIRVPNLRPGGSFMFRVRAETEVGAGAFSDWTSEIKLELTEVNAKDTAASRCGGLS